MKEITSYWFDVLMEITSYCFDVLREITSYWFDVQKRANLSNSYFVLRIRADSLS